jgi:hypothetical protein
VALCYSSECRIINKSDVQKLEYNTRNHLQDWNTREILTFVIGLTLATYDTKLYKNSWLDDVERMERNCLPNWPFNINFEDDGMLVNP